MEPTLREGDWLLVDPTTTRWPRPGSIVAFLEPESGILAVKRVAAGPGEGLGEGAHEEPAAAGVQLGHDVVKQQDRGVPGLGAHQADLGHLHRQHCRALLAA